jgi:hypothetical protein
MLLLIRFALQSRSLTRDVSGTKHTHLQRTCLSRQCAAVCCKLLEAKQSSRAWIEVSMVDNLICVPVSF